MAAMPELANFVMPLAPIDKFVPLSVKATVAVVPLPISIPAMLVVPALG